MSARSETSQLYYRNGNSPDNARTAMMKRHTMTPAVLHVLLALHRGPMHGYAIMKEARSSAGAGVPMGPGTVYGTLDRLLQSGWIREITPKKSRRRLFEILPSGREALEHEAARIERLARLVHDRGVLASEGGGGN